MDRINPGKAVRPVSKAAFIVCLLASLCGNQIVGAAPSPIYKSKARLAPRGILERAGPLLDGATLQPLDECPVKTTDNVSCANLLVPERRDVPSNRTITVRVAVLHAPEEDRHSDPLVFLMGGQGQGFSVLNEIDKLPSVLKRDVITLEQRGTQLAKPFFGCPGVESGVAGIDQILTSQPSKSDPAEIERCKSQIDRAGIERNAYDTVASADDLWDLKQLLKVEQWNLFGVSYGGRTAETFLRKHPDAARSLIVDSVQVTGVPFVFGYARHTKISKFFSRCAATDSCGGRFPDLKDHFERTVACLEQNPVPVTVAGQNQTLTANAYIRIVTRILYDKGESIVSELPAAVVAAAHENYAPLLALEDRYADVISSKPPQPGEYPFDLELNIAQQTHVLCSEEYPPLAGPNGDVQLPFPDGWTPAVQRVAEAEQRAQAEVCRLWDVKPSEIEQGQLPPRNEIPTLMMHGEHDPIAPSEDQDILALSYPRSTRVVFLWTGHAILGRRQACSIPMFAAFVASPGAPVNTSCAEQIKEPEWLSQAPQADEPESYLPMMQNVAANQAKNYGFPGVTVHIDLRQANISGTIAVGLADPATGRQLTGQEPSRMGSMTKTYTAAAVLRLVEIGKIDLSSAAASYLTEETQQQLRSGGYDPRAMTVQHLLQHTSGLPDYNDELFAQRLMDDPSHEWTRREQVQWALDHLKPTSAPGTVFEDSDTGYNLLGEIIEQVSGLPQAAAYRALLPLDRLGLRHTWFEKLEQAPTDLPDRAHQFVGPDDATFIDASFDLWGGGGLLATTADEAAFLRALMLGQVFERPETLRTMLAVPESNAAAGYGMGIHRIEAGAVECWGHTGYFGTDFAHCPAEDVTVATDRHKSVKYEMDYDPLEMLTTALRINRLALHPASS